MSIRLEFQSRIVPVGDSAVLIELGEVLDSAINQQVYALDEWLAAGALDGVLARVPGYCSILISYDPQKLTFSEVTNWLEERLISCPPAGQRQPRLVTIPVCYGGEDGPDLEDLAQLHRMSLDEVVRRHTAPVLYGRYDGLYAGLFLLDGVGPRVDDAPSGEPPHTGARRCGWDCRRADRHLPSGLPRRMAADWTDGSGPL